MIKKLLMVLVLGTLLVGTLGISAGPMIADRAMAQDQTQTEDGGIIKYVMTKVFESGFRMFMKAIPPDELVDIAMEARPDVMEMVAARFETKAYADTISMLIAENPMFIYDIVSELEAKSLSKSVNVLLREDPALMSDVVSGLDAESLSMSINMILTEKPVFISDVVSGLDEKSSSKVVNTLLNENPALISEIIGGMDMDPLVEPIAALFEDNPGLLADLMEQLDEDTLNSAINEVLEETNTVVVAELPEQRMEATVPLPPDVARILGMKEIRLKPTVATGPMDVRVTKIIIKKGGKK